MTESSSHGTRSGKIKRLASQAAFAAHRLQQKYGLFETGEEDKKFEEAKSKVGALASSYHQLDMLTLEFRQSWTHVVDVASRLGDAMECIGRASPVHGGTSSALLSGMLQKMAEILKDLDQHGEVKDGIDQYHSFLRKFTEVELAPVEELVSKAQRSKLSSDFFQRRLEKSRRKGTMSGHPGVPGGPAVSTIINEKNLVDDHQNIAVAREQFVTSDGDSIVFSAPCGSPPEEEQPTFSSSSSSTVDTHSGRKESARTTLRKPLTGWVRRKSNREPADAILAAEELKKDEERAAEARELYFKDRSVVISGLTAIENDGERDHFMELSRLVSCLVAKLGHVHSDVRLPYTSRASIDPLSSASIESSVGRASDPHEMMWELKRGWEDRQDSPVIDWVELADEMLLLTHLKKTDEQISKAMRGKRPRPSFTSRTRLRYMTLVTHSDLVTDESPLSSLERDTEDRNETETFYDDLDQPLGQVDHAMVQYILIAGTNFRNMKHILLDLDTALELDDKVGVKMHRGFREAGRELYTALASDLSKEAPIKIVGHSLGGAAGQILAAYLIKEDFVVESVHALGSPKFTDEAGAQCLNSLFGSRLLRISNYMDVVRTLPRGQYTHFGRNVLVFDDGSLWDLSESPPAEPARYTSHSKWFSAHRSATYAQLCRRQLEKALGIASRFSANGATPADLSDRSRTQRSLRRVFSLDDMSSKAKMPDDKALDESMASSEQEAGTARTVPSSGDSSVRSTLLGYVVTSAASAAYRLRRRWETS